MKIRPERECVEGKCEGFMPQGHVRMLPSGGIVLRSGVEALPTRAGVEQCLLPYHARALLGPGQRQGRVSCPCTSKGCIHPCIHCHRLRL